jgi:hypothetical protein
MTDPDREELREAIKCCDDWLSDDAMYQCRQKHLSKVIAAARRDLARLEAWPDPMKSTDSRVVNAALSKQHGREYAKALVDEMHKLFNEPKRASLGELVEHVENSAKNLKPGMHYVVTNRTSDLDLQAAAVLRAVGEFRGRWKDAASSTDESGLTAEFVRSLP